MQFGLPADVKRHVRNKVLKRVLLWALLELVFGGVLIIWGKQIFHTGSWPALDVICYCVVLLIPFAVCGIPFKLIDRTWYGVVEKVDIKTTWDNDQPFKPTYEHFYLKNTIRLTVKQPDKEKTVKRRVYAGKAKQQQHINDYKTGDKVFHLYGTQHTVILPAPSEGHMQCAVCGMMNDISEKPNSEKAKCRNCHLTLICNIE